jgi:hypothetical protein
LREGISAGEVGGRRRSMDDSDGGGGHGGDDALVTWRAGSAVSVCTADHSFQGTISSVQAEPNVGPKIRSRNLARFSECKANAVLLKMQEACTKACTGQQRAMRPCISRCAASSHKFRGAVQGARGRRLRPSVGCPRPGPAAILRAVRGSVPSGAALPVGVGVQQRCCGAT